MTGDSPLEVFAFQRFTDNHTIDAYTAYLKVDEPGTRTIILATCECNDFGIEHIHDSPQDVAIYNLSEQRVTHITKSIYIINGKKVIMYEPPLLYTMKGLQSATHQRMP